MTQIFNDPTEFKDDVIAGFARAYPQYVQRVPNAAGFLRAAGPGEGKVSLVIGGGSGHYPSYSGVVGQGFADGAVLGDVFASPSAEQVVRVGRAANGGAGVILAFGNYAGDRLNFGIAQERLVAEGIDARVVFVTDDIASAKPGEAEKRRGIAGSFTVYKIGGAAGDKGCDIDTVERLMRKANDATFSYGVAFAGCTLPGSDQPLFTVDDGQMDFGLGIHGEPGIRSAAWMPARELAQELVGAILKERPAESANKAAVLVNGLGGTKYEELFVLYNHVADLLEAQGVESVIPEIGELVTSLDMAGCSLSITWLDAELEEYWLAPAATPAFRRGAFGSDNPTFAVRESSAPGEVEATTSEVASDASIAAGEIAKKAVHAMTQTVLDNEQELGAIDAVAGDGDHGAGMARGCKAADAAAQSASGGVQSILTAAGEEFGDKAGGTSGILWGMLLSTAGTTLGNTEEVTAERTRVAVRAAADSIKRVGKAELGDKTMLDALYPFLDALDARIEDGDRLSAAWVAAAQVAVQAAIETASLVPKIGRARPLAERSVGTADAGAVSMGMILTAIGGVLAGND